MTDNSTPIVKATAADLQPPIAATSTALGAGTAHTELDALDEQDRVKIELLSEQVSVQKQERQSGEVQISKRVIEEQVQVPVTLRREEVTITRNPTQALPNPALAQSSDIFKEETFTILVHEEVPTVTKTTRIVERIEVQKRVVSEDKTISEVVRREEAVIDQGTTGRVTVENDAQTRLS